MHVNGSSGERRWSTGLIAVLCLALMLASDARGQILRGDWVDASQAAIEQHRKTDLHVIVLDEAGEYVRAAEVHVLLEQHAFDWGIHLSAEAFAEGAAPTWNADTPVWRCLNAVALDDASAWTAMQPVADERREDALRAMIDWCRARRLRMRWGGVVSADPEHLPRWVGELEDAQLRAAIEQRIEHVLTRYAGVTRAFDLHPHVVDHRFVEARLGTAMVRHMHEYARALAPDARIGFRFENCLVSGRLQAALQRLTELREAFVPGDCIVLDDEVTGTVLPVPLQRAMQWLRGTGLPVVVGRLEVSGGSATGAAVNMEILLRILFAEPTIEGIYLNGITADQVTHEHAALVDTEGELTVVGRTFEGLVRGLWWTDEKAKTDQLGNVRMRVFAGTYRITATMPDGSRVVMRTNVPRADEPRLVVVQPIGGNAGAGDHAADDVEAKTPTSEPEREPAQDEESLQP